MYEDERDGFSRKSGRESGRSKSKKKKSKKEKRRTPTPEDEDSWAENY